MYICRTACACAGAEERLLAD